MKTSKPSLIYCFLCFLIFSSLVNSYKILGLFPHPSKSHHQIYFTLMKSLSQKGHEITVLSHFPLPKPIANYTNIVFEKNVKMASKGANYFMNLQRVKSSFIHKLIVLEKLNQFSKISCAENFASSSVKTLLESNSSFDIIITHAFNSDCFASLSNKFQAPIIAISTSYVLTFLNERIGNPTFPSFVPNSHHEYYHTIPFWGRVENVLLGIIQQFYYNYVMMKNGQKQIKEYFGENAKSLMETVLNTSLLFVNTHSSFHSPRPIVPAFVEVGGLHVGEVKKLAFNLEKWINESTHGVIYFSLGSMIKGHTFPDEKRREFLKAFGRLPQRILWKWENETMPEKPDNVMIQKWMPQLDILCHPNVKAFISHGGLLGTTEAVHCGVPMMVMPQYGDQFTNAKALEANGGGVILHLYEATEEKVYEALKTILDPKFKKQAEDLSARFKDRPLPPLETAIYWVEYVARHRGAHHMRTAAVGMPLYKYLLLDVIAFLLLVFVVISVLIFYITRTIFRKLFSKKEKEKRN